MADKWQVELFLREFKRAWTPDCVVVPRDKNNQALAAVGLTPAQRRDIIMGLGAEDYVAGPMPDEEHPDQMVWIFGQTVEQAEMYIKLILRELAAGFLAKCLSFHAAEHAMRYPLA